MDCGKSTLALQIDHNYRQRGLRGLILSSRDRAGQGRLSSRLGLQVPAEEIDPTVDVWQLLVGRLTAGAQIDYVVCDEAQFYTERQIDDLARIVDELQRDVFAFGILTDFRTKLFPGSARLVELADRVQTLQVEALCWCGRRATHNARTIDGAMVVEGDQVMVGDTGSGSPNGDLRDHQQGQVGYEVLCRRHHRRRVTAAAAKVDTVAPPVLPFGDEAR